jgi:hypothetical protein
MYCLIFDKKLSGTSLKTNWSSHRVALVISLLWWDKMYPFQGISSKDLCRKKQGFKFLSEENYILHYCWLKLLESKNVSGGVQWVRPHPPSKKNCPEFPIANEYFRIPHLPKKVSNSIVPPQKTFLDPLLNDSHFNFDW